MISNKFFTPDGSTSKFLSDVIIKSELYCRVYNYVYDAGGVDGSVDPTTGLFVRVNNSPDSDDVVTLENWTLVDNYVSFYTAPQDTSTVVIEVGTTPEELGDVVAGSAVLRAETAAAEAETSATAAAASETAAGTSEINAATSASNASTSETNAATSASNASTSETNASTSASNASTSETNAAASEAAAAISETNADTSATTATTQAGIATTQASNASTSASNASTSETNAAASAADAAQSAIDAATFDPSSYYLKTELDGGQLDTRYYTETESDATFATTTALNLKAPIASPTFTGNVTFVETTETTYSLTGTDIDPANGTIQYKTISTNTTFTESLADGQSVTLILTAGDSYTITWPTVTWIDGAAPTLTADDTLVFFQVGTEVFGKYIGTNVSA